MREKHFAAAAQSFDAALDACPERHSLLLRLSDANARRREFTSAIAEAHHFLELENGSIEGELALANAYFMAQQFSQSLAQVNTVLKSNPAQPAALKLKGNIEYFKGEYSQAFDTFIELLDHHPDDEDAAYMLGRIYYQEGRSEQAAGQFQRVLRINPHSYKALDNLGLCYQALGDTEMAKRYFLTSIKYAEENDADYDWAYANLANLLLEQGDAERAYAAASKAADRNPYSARNFYLGGKALARLGKTDLSINWLERSVALDPKYPEPLYTLAKLYADTGKKEEAKATLEKFRQVKAANPQERE